MSDLTEFLLARYAEDEAVATGALGMNMRAWELERTCERHCVGIDPRRVLAECEARRRTVGWYRTVSDSKAIHVDAWTVLKEIIRDLASVYADHPDFRPEWESA